MNEADWLRAVLNDRPERYRDGFRTRCEGCGAELAHTGYRPRGGRIVIVATCPRCDRKDRDEE